MKSQIMIRIGILVTSFIFTIALICSGSMLTIFIIRWFDGHLSTAKAVMILPLCAVPVALPLFLRRRHGKHASGYKTNVSAP